MRDFRLIIPSDCVASAEPENHRRAVDHLTHVLRAETRPSTALDLASLTGRS
jgi:hypothetical protein